MSTEFRSYEETVADVLGRYSVTDLIEQSDDDLRQADEQFYKSDKPMEILEQGTVGFINWWKVRSGDETYEIRRFKAFCWCQCRSFFFRKKMCRHLALTTGVYCIRCHVLRATEDKYCYDCDMVTHRFLKPSAIKETV